MRRICLAILLVLSVSAQAWDWWPLPMAEPDSCRDSLRYEFSVSAFAGSGQYSAFWMQSGEAGCVPMSPYGGSIRAALVKPATRPSRWFDYDFALDVIGTAHSALPVPEAFQQTGKFPVYQAQHGGVTIHRCYAHVRLYIVDISAGVMPVADDMNSPLGSGSLLFSHNAPSMPSIRIGFDRWTPIPGLYGYAEVRGGIMLGWLTDHIGIHKGKLHYKWAGIQLGGRLPVNISYEIHHAAQWGGYSADYGDLGNDWNAFLRVFTAQSGKGSYNETYNAMGNHLGSQQLALTVKGQQWQVKAYWQNILEDNFNLLGQGHNLPDGRWGVSATQHVWPYLHTLTAEYICTTDQSGPQHDQDGIIYAGRDDYYRNSIYSQGWNYYLRTIGTPLITSPLYNTDGDIQTRNNRIQAWHIGIGGDVYGFQYRILATHVRNYGRYLHDDWYNRKSENTALMLDVSKRVEQAWGLEFGGRIAADFGSQWGNQVSAMIRISKKGILTTYK